MTTKCLLAGIAGLLALSAAGAASAATNFLPGLYETKVSYPGQDTGTETRRECVTPAEAKQESLEWHLAQSLQDTACTFTQRSIAGGRFALVGTCDNAGFRSTVRQTGTYSPTSMTMNLSMTITPPGSKPVRLDTVMSGRRIAATCPPGTDRD